MSGRSVADRASRALMLAGGAIAIVAVGAWVLDVLPDVPAWMLRLAIYKLTLASGAGLIIAGAVLRRSIRGATIPPSSPPGAGTLGAGSAPNASTRKPEPERVRRRAEDQ
jgi:hypothetical protein